MTLTVDTVPLGSPWSEAAATDRAAIAARRTVASAVVFPADLQPSTADAIAEYGFLTSRLGLLDYGARLAEHHKRAMVANPRLAALFRSHAAREDVADAAARIAVPASDLETLEAAQHRAAAAAVTAYQSVVAAQVAAVEGHELQAAARELVECVELEQRLAAAVAKHEAHAAAELERVEAERRAVARAVADKTVERVREAEAKAADDLAKATLSATVYRQLRAEALADRLRASALRELRIGGEEGGVFGIDDLIATAPRMSIEQIARYEAALAANEGA